jgi:hypothetical protein
MTPQSSIHRMEDLEIDARNDGGFRIVSVNHYPSTDELNLPAYRYSHTIIVRWTDDDMRRGHTLAESFDGWADTPEAAQAEANRKWAAWGARMHRISAWTSRPAPADNRPAFSFQPARTSARSVVLPASAWGNDDRRIEDTRKEVQS